MLDLRAHPTRVLAETSATTIAVRGKDGTYEKRRRVTLGDVPVGYRDASGGGERAGETLYIHPNALSAFDYERDHGAGGADVREDAPPPPCIVGGAGGATQIDLEVRQGAETRASEKHLRTISASRVDVDVVGPAHACDGALVEFLGRVLGLRLAQMSLMRGHKQTSRTLLAKGTSPTEAYRKLREVMIDERERAGKIARGEVR